jgi:hypothetical protein
LTSKKKINELLNRTINKYDQLWMILLTLKRQVNRKITSNDLIEFQVELGKTLYFLTKKYKLIVNEKRNIIHNKNRYKSGWFKNRLKALSLYQGLINKYILIGKSLGDSFCWLFYFNDKRMVKKHLQRPEQFYFPTGIGGIAEVEYISKIHAMKNHFTLLHGNTNILRIGDFSFINLKTFKLSALGEIKSKEEKSGLLNIQLHLMGNRKPVDAFFTEVSNKNQSKDKVQIGHYKPDDRLKRQKITMQNFWQKQQNELIKKKNIWSNQILNFNIIEKAFCLTKTNQFSHTQYDDGLILSIYKLRKASPISDLNQINKNSFAKDDNLVELTRNIIVKNSKYNTLVSSSFFHGSQKNLNWYLELPPLFWLPINHRLLKLIYFHNVIIIATINPASIINKLESLGYKVKIKKSLISFSISKHIGRKVFEIPDFSYYMRLILLHLVTENTIIELLKVLENMDLPKTKKNQRIKIFPEIDFIF